MCECFYISYRYGVSYNITCHSPILKFMCNKNSFSYYVSFVVYSISYDLICMLISIVVLYSCEASNLRLMGESSKVRM